MTETNVQRLLTAKEVAERLGRIHPRTVARLAEAGKIPKPLKATYGKGKVWREADIDQHIASQERES